MAGGIDRLTDQRVRAFIKQAKAGAAPTGKISDGGGLYVMVTPAGSAVWRVKYRIDGKERVFSPGAYPEVSLAEARLARADVRKLIKEGHDPVADRRRRRAANAVAATGTFREATEAWLAKRKGQWSRVHYATSRRALERDVLPYIGNLPIVGITTPMYANVIERIVRRGSNETARKVLFNVRRIIALAKTRDNAVDKHIADPVSEVLVQVKPYAPRRALLEFPALGDVLRRAEVANLSPAVRMALRLAAFSAQRLGNIVESRWDDFDLDAAGGAVWVIQRSAMKVQSGRFFDHKILIGNTFAAELKQWRTMTGGRGFLFPSPTGNGDHITKESLSKAYKKTLGLSAHSVHGWRSSFSTLAKDAGGFDKVAVELTLDHVGDVKIVRTYDRGERLSERRGLAEWWANSLLAAQQGGEPIPPGGR
jgi:integrase